MKVTLLANTTLHVGAMGDESHGEWVPEDGYSDGSALAEFAGRQCYESWSRPNPATATNKGYIQNIIDQRHFSVLEHGTVSLRFSGISRACTHELVRHRHFSYSQLSQRYVKVDEGSFVIPPLYRMEWEEDSAQAGETQMILEEQWVSAVTAYDRLVAIHLPKLLSRGVDSHTARKMAREAARAVLPNMTPTAIVVSGNHLSWRQFLEKRGSLAADREIREMAVMVYRILAELEPNLYQDFDLIGQTDPVPGGFSVEMRRG